VLKFYTTISAFEPADRDYKFIPTRYQGQIMNLWVNLNPHPPKGSKTKFSQNP